MNTRESLLQTRAALRNFQCSSQLTLLEARDLYLAHLAVAANTRHHISNRIEQFIRHFPQTQVAAVTPQLVDAWFQKRKDAIAPHSLFHDVSLYRRWFQFLVNQGVIPASPFAHLRVSRPTASEARVIGYSEESAIVSAVTERVRLRILLSLDAGVAVGEIISLRRHRIDFRENLITSWRHKNKRERTIPLTKRLARELGKQCGHLTPDALICARGAEKLSGGQRFIPGLIRRLGFHFRFHDLRHTFATRLAAATTNPFVVAALLGHALPHWVHDRAGRPIPTTTARYVHPVLADLRAAIAEMERQNPNCQDEK